MPWICPVCKITRDEGTEDPTKCAGLEKEGIKIDLKMLGKVYQDMIGLCDLCKKPKDKHYGPKLLCFSTGCCICWETEKRRCPHCSRREDAAHQAVEQVTELVRKSEIGEALKVIREARKAAGSTFQEKFDKIALHLLISRDEGFDFLNNHDESNLIKNGLLDASLNLSSERVRVSDIFCGSQISRKIQYLDSLTSLDISNHHKLEELPLQALASIPSLKSVTCVGCPKLLSIPQEISNQGGERTLAFIHEVAEGGKENIEMPLCIIGNSKVGKTSLLRAMRSNIDRAHDIPVERRTIGIDVTSWSVEEKLRFRVFDFAGIPLYRAFQQVCFPRRALYILVWRAVPLAESAFEEIKPRIEEMLVPWLQALAANVSGVSILLAVSHIDVIPTENLDVQCQKATDIVSKFIKKRPNCKFKILLDGLSHKINPRTGAGIDQIRGDLKGFAVNMPGYLEMWPNSWLRLEQRLGERALQEPWLSMVGYRAQASAILGSDLEMATSFLHGMGRIRCLGDLSDPGGMVFISVYRAMDYIKGVVRHHHTPLLDYFREVRDHTKVTQILRLHSKGVLHQDLLPFLWPSITTIVHEEQEGAEDEVRADPVRFWQQVEMTTDQDNPLWISEYENWRNVDIAKGKELSSKLEGSGLARKESSNSSTSDDSEWGMERPGSAIMTGVDEARGAARFGALLKGNGAEDEDDFRATHLGLRVTLPSFQDAQRPVELLKRLYLLQQIPNRKEFIVPALTEQRKLHPLKRSAYSLDECPFEGNIIIPEYLPGLNSFVQLRMWEKVESSSISPNLASFFHLGTKIHLNFTPGRNRTTITVSASTTKGKRLGQEAVVETLRSYPMLDPDEDMNFTPSSTPRDAIEPVQVLLVVSSETFGYKRSPRVARTRQELLEVFTENHTDKASLLVQKMLRQLPGHLTVEILCPQGGFQGVGRVVILFFDEALKKKHQTSAKPARSGEATPVIRESPKTSPRRHLEQTLSESPKAKDPHKRHLLRMPDSLGGATPPKSSNTSPRRRSVSPTRRVSNVFAIPNILNQKLSFVVRRSAEMIADGSKIVPVVLPDTLISEYSHWWPQGLPWLEEFKIFVDFRDEERWDEKFTSELIPQVNARLLQWRGMPDPEVPKDWVVCPSCTYLSYAAGYQKLRHDCHVYQVDDLEYKQLMWIQSDFKSQSQDMPTATCPKHLHTWHLPELVASAFYSDSVACPVCSESGSFPYGHFDLETALQMFHFKGHDRHDTAGLQTLTCTTCEEAVPILDVIVPEILISYEWGPQKCVHELVQPVCRKLETLIDMRCWLDVAVRSENYWEYFLEGITRADLVIIFLSDVYCNTERRVREFLECVVKHKVLVPILLPDQQYTEMDGVVTTMPGWSGPLKPGRDWWKHADSMCRMMCPGATQVAVPWGYLSSFHPIDLREVENSENGSWNFEAMVSLLLHRVSGMRQNHVHTVHQSLLDVNSYLKQLQDNERERMRKVERRKSQAIEAFEAFTHHVPYAPPSHG